MNLICFSHLRWNFVYQRPQHILSRFSNQYVTYYVEEFIINDQEDGFDMYKTKENVLVVTPHLNSATFSENDKNLRVNKVIKNLFAEEEIKDYMFWYYTPMALAFTKSFRPKVIIFDCMDELSAFKFAPQELKTFEQELLDSADIVFTGGNSLYEAKKNQHHNIFSFPSSIDKTHFSQARQVITQPEDQKNIPYPRLGFFGVIDERFDIDLIEQAATLKPDWQFVLIGPVVKIDPATLPKNSNIHYLGGKSYQELPIYLSGWDISMIPFAINESTKYISPTKTPEYLAAGKPVVSSAINDVVYPYGENNLVHIVNDAFELIEKASEELALKDKSEWLERVDDYLDDISWDLTCSKMQKLVKIELDDKEMAKIVKLPRIMNNDVLTRTEVAVK
jgi:glycosyltransferase involved in cell wall biosynthesis